METIPYRTRLLRLCCGCVLTVAGAWGGIVGLRASVAQALYKHAKYGMRVGTRLERPAPTDLPTILEACVAAHRLYDRNYYVPILMSSRALGTALAARDAAEFEWAFGHAEHWNHVARALNPYDREAAYGKLRILQERGDHAGAIRFWRDEVLERQFWDPQLHETLVEVYLRAGRLSQALEASRWLRSGETLRRVRVLEQRRNALRQAEQSGTD